MKISILTQYIKLTTIFKYLILKQKLQNKGIEIEVFVSSIFKKTLNEVIDRFKIIDRYRYYCNELSNFNFREFSFENLKLIDDSDLIILSSDFYQIPIYCEKYSNIFKKYLNRTRKKIVYSKMRSCNDFFYSTDFCEDKLNPIWVSSKMYKKIQTFNPMPIGNEKITYSFGKRLDECFSMIDYVNPLEICDVENPFVKFEENSIRNKYNLNNKPIIIYFYPKYDDLSIGKGLNSEIIQDKYDVLMVNKPYYLKNSNDRRIIDFFDYSFIIQNMVFCIIGGLSTAVRESLIYKIPVLNMIDDRSFMPRKGTTLKNHMKKRFGISFKNSSQFEGKSVDFSLKEDFKHWIKLLEEISYSDFNFTQKKDVWFSNLTIEDKIKELLL